MPAKKKSSTDRRPYHENIDAPVKVQRSFYERPTPNRDLDPSLPKTYTVFPNGVGKTYYTEVEFKPKREHQRKYPRYQERELRGYWSKNWKDSVLTSCRLAAKENTPYAGGIKMSVEAQLQRLFISLTQSCAARGLKKKNGDYIEGYPLFTDKNGKERFRPGLKKVVMEETGFSSATIWRILTGSVYWIYTFLQNPPAGVAPYAHIMGAGRWQVPCPRYETVWNGDKRRGRYIHKSNYIIQELANYKRLKFIHHPELYAEDMGLTREQVQNLADFKCINYAEEYSEELAALGISQRGNPYAFQKYRDGTWIQAWPWDGICATTGYAYETERVQRFSEDMESLKKEGHYYKFTTENWPRYISRAAVNLLKKFAAEGFPHVDPAVKDELHLFGFDSGKSVANQGLMAEATLDIINYRIGEGLLSVSEELSGESQSRIDGMKKKTAKVLGKKEAEEPKPVNQVTRVVNINQRTWDILSRMANTDTKLELDDDMVAELALFDGYDHKTATVYDIWLLYDKVEFAIKKGKMTVTEEPTRTETEIIPEFIPIYQGFDWPRKLSRKAYDYLSLLITKDIYNPQHQYDVRLCNELALFGIDARDGDCPDTRRMARDFLRGLMTPNSKGWAKLTLVDD